MMTLNADPTVSAAPACFKYISNKFKGGKQMSEAKCGKKSRKKAVAMTVKRRTIEKLAANGEFKKIARSFRKERERLDRILKGQQLAMDKSPIELNNRIFAYSKVPIK